MGERTLYFLYFDAEQHCGHFNFSAKPRPFTASLDNANVRNGNVDLNGLSHATS